MHPKKKTNPNLKTPPFLAPVSGAEGGSPALTPPSLGFPPAEAQFQQQPRAGRRLGGRFRGVVEPGEDGGVAVLLLW